MEGVNMSKHLRINGHGGSPFELLASIPFPAPHNAKFTFIDLFAGIGGFRLAMQNLGGQCVFSSEWDYQAQRTYHANYGEWPCGDITLEETKEIIPENFDILCAGFPCQAFSIAGKRRGFEEARGTLFFEVVEIIRKKRPRAVLLENVKGLMTHDKGRSFGLMLEVLREDLKYIVPTPRTLSACDYGLPQRRDRVFIVGFREDIERAEAFQYPKPIQPTLTLADIKEHTPVSVKYYLSDRYLSALRKHKARHETRGNGFGYEIIPDDGIANAVVCGGMGRERNLIYDYRLTDFTPITNIKGEVNREGIRRMTPREWARLQGFPDTFRIVVSDTAAYKLIGNSVAVPLVQSIAEQILTTLE